MNNITYMMLSYVPASLRKIFFSVAASCFLLATSAAWAEGPKTGIETAKTQWSVSAGFGSTHPGLGDTKTRVRTADLVLGYGRFLSNETGGSAWYRGRHQLIVEVPLHYVGTPEQVPMAGITFLACWNFTASKTITPYIFAGGGLIYTNLDVPELGRRLNGTIQEGIGAHYFLSKDTSIDLSYRFHHISNAGTAKPNGPLNSSKVFLGVSFFR
jgi:opacity protein-like surface antigen